MKFQRNDLIRGIHPNRYTVTNDQMTLGRVLNVSDNGRFIDVKVLEHRTLPNNVGMVYCTVDSEFFALVKPRCRKLYDRQEVERAILDDRFNPLEYDLSGADLSMLDLSYADLSYADLRGANLGATRLMHANLYGADLRGAKLYRTDLRYANLSDTKGIMSPIKFMEENFERTNDGYIVYKTFGSQYLPNPRWVIEAGSILEENANFNRSNECGCGINVAPYEWVLSAADGDALPIWKCLIRYEWLPGVVVPYGSDGKIRCERLELLEVVNGK